MKLLSFFGIAAFGIVALSCTQKGNDQASADADTTAAPVVVTPVVKKINVVTWNEVSIKETPSEKGKYVTSVYLNENIQLTGDTASEKSGSKRNHYHKVTLSDGKSGWIREEFIAIDVQPAAIKVTATAVYKRPDAATVTDKTFNWTNYIVVKKAEGNFLEVQGKIPGEKWFTSGFIIASSVSYDKLDVEYAALKCRASEEMKQKIQDALYTQLEDPKFFGESELWRKDYTSEEEEELAAEGDEESGVEGPRFSITPPTEGLVGFYSMDDGKVEDQSGRGNHGEAFFTELASDKLLSRGGAMKFLGNSYATISDNNGSDIKPPFTVSAYFRLDDPAKIDQCVVSRGRSTDGTGFNFGYTVKDDGKTVVYLGLIGTRPVSAESQVKIDGGEWVLLTGSFDMDRVKLYLNGKLVNSSYIPPQEAELAYQNLADSDQPLEIGRELQNLNRYFFGAIDNVCLWNRALTDAEILGMYKE